MYLTQADILNIHCLSLSLSPLYTHSRQYGQDFHPDPNIMGVFNNFTDHEPDEVSAQYVQFPSVVVKSG